MRFRQRFAVIQAKAARYQREQQQQQQAAATVQAPSLPPSSCQNSLRPSCFEGEQAAEYEAYLDELAEAHERQLDAEAAAYAHSFAGAGMTEYLMAMEG